MKSMGIKGVDIYQISKGKNKGLYKFVISYEDGRMHFFFLNGRDHLLKIIDLAKGL